MMKLLAEQPIFVAIVLTILAAGFVYSWTRSNQRWMLYVGALLLLLVPVAWLVANLVVTDDEQIKMMIESFAERVEANDVEGALQSIHPSRPEIRQRVAAELPNYEFDRANVGGYQAIRMVPNQDPPQAVVDLIAGVTVSLKNGGIEDQKLARRLLLLLEKTSDGWKVIDYSHRSPVGKLDPYSSGTKDWEKWLQPAKPTTN